jgi:hypothetical protein
MIDYLPVNASISNGGISDSYIEWVLPASETEFFDLTKLNLELKTQFRLADGEPIPAAHNVQLVNGYGHRVINKLSVFLNSTCVESMSHYGLYNMVKHYLTSERDEVESRGRAMFYQRDNVTDVPTFTPAQFENLNAYQTVMNNSIRNTVHTYTPLSLDIAGSNFYLINGVEIRIRIELAPINILLNGTNDQAYEYRVTMAKLWTEKVIPQSEALISLNRSITSTNSFIEYIYPLSTLKEYIFPAGSRTLSLENIFNSVIPNKLFVFMVDQTALNGQLNRNSTYLPHCNLSNVRLEINGSTFASLNSSWPNEISQLFMHTLNSLGTNKHLLTYENFKNGKCIICFDLRATDVEDCIALEPRGTLRLKLSLSEALTSNICVFIAGITHAAVYVSASRRVTTNFMV